MQLLSSSNNIRRRAFKRSTALLLISLATSALCAGFLLQEEQASAACATPTPSYGSVTSSVRVPSDGMYRIWTRLMAPDATRNSYSLEVDGSVCYVVGDTGLAANQWGWVDYQGGNTATKITLKLTAGAHTFKLVGREPGVKIDRVMAVLDGTCATGPTGMGDNCMIDADTISPAVAITAPAEGGATVSGVVNTAVTATDTKGVARVDFYVDGALLATDATAPYTYNWNTAGMANGTHTVMVKAYDTAGNIGIDTNTVTVRNGDSQAPTVPTNVKAAATAANKVTVAWTASTDNGNVAGYTVRRNGVVIASAVNATAYVDTTVAPGGTYMYAVAAYDTAGNISAVSTAATVSMPPAPDSQAPSAPTGMTARASSSTQINLSWTASSDDVAVVRYDIYRGTIGNDLQYFDTYTGLLPMTTITYGNTGLKPSTQYSYYVIAKDANGNASAASATVSATTQTAPGIPSQPVDPSLPPAPPAKTGVIRGKVTGGKKKHAVSGVRVTAVANGKRYIATTNGSGIYRFSNLPAGKYKVHYRVSGHQPGDETLRLKEGKDIIWNMWLVKRGERSHWWNR